MGKPIDRTLMRRSILWVLHRYSTYSIGKMNERRIRGWREGDEEALCTILRALRRAWSEELTEYHFLKRNNMAAKMPHFEIFKTKFLDKKAAELKWSIETRNLYSSVISTYIGFENKPTKKRIDELVQLEKDFNKFMRPNKVAL